MKKPPLARSSSCGEQIEQINSDIEKAQEAGDYEQAAKLKYGILPETKKQLEQEYEAKIAELEPAFTTSIFILFFYPSFILSLQ